ncbi:glycosyltransferase family 2 protein [Candidatus Uhrbacteria bacterium]|nr:glycosyltransferase family 2 protein [Candidatus Uhrbacteria bacterium]
MNISVVIPAYNEASMIGQVVQSVLPMVSQVVVIDDGSSDTTAQVAAQAGAVVLRHMINRGQGAALQTGTRYCLENGSDVIVHFDADGQFEPAEIPKMMEPVLNGQVDLVIGSRFLKSNQIPTLRRLFLKFGILFTWFFAGIKLTDTHNGFRVLSRKAAELIILTQDRSAHASEIIEQVFRHDLKWLELPVSVKYTAYSTSRQDGVRNEGNVKKIRVAVRFILSKLLS